MLVALPSASTKHLTMGLTAATPHLAQELGATLVLWPNVDTWNASGTFSDFLT